MSVDSRNRQTLNNQFNWLLPSTQTPEREDKFSLALFSHVFPSSLFPDVTGRNTWHFLSISSTFLSSLKCLVFFFFHPFLTSLWEMSFPAMTEWETEVMRGCCCCFFFSFLSWKDRSLATLFPLSTLFLTSFLPCTWFLPRHHYPRKPFTPKRQEEKKESSWKSVREEKRESRTWTYRKRTREGENDASQLLHHVIKTDTHSLSRHIPGPEGNMYIEKEQVV